MWVQTNCTRASQLAVFLDQRVRILRRLLCQESTPTHEADVMVARALLTDFERSLTLGNKAYLGCGIYTPPKTNAVSPGIWTSLMNTTRKMIESVFSPLTRTKHLVLGQHNSFRSIRDHTCRKIAAHDFACFFIP